MEIITAPHVFQSATRQWLGSGLSSALVPTMGALHEGHLSLIAEGKRRADRLCVSLFVNPAQFGPGEDLNHYPRPFDADAESCRSLGVDVLFAPTPEAIYPAGFQTHVSVEQMTRLLCGAGRPGHFQGVTTVVLKLLLLAQPTCALFGWKDAQQLLVIRHMARDLNLAVEIVGVETVREPDGLAMSSRNAYLTPAERADAPLIHQGLLAAREAFAGGERSGSLLCDRVRQSIDQSPQMRIEYVEARSLRTLEPLEEVVQEGTLLAVAVRLGRARLIDNIRL